MATEHEPQARVQAWLDAFPAASPVVVVPIYNAYDDVLECVHHLALHTTADVPVLLVDDASPDERLARELEPLARAHGFCYVRQAANSGFVGTVNAAFAWCAARDVVIVNSDVVVPAEWLPRLQAAAYARSNVATATPFTNYGTILSLPYRDRPMPEIADGLSLTEADRRVRRASLLLRPLIPTAVGHCTYFRRSALDAVGGFDEALAPGYGEEVDFSQRAVAMGFCHVVADDLFVYHKGSRSFGAQSAAREAMQLEHERINNARYPWYLPWVRELSQNAQHPLTLAIERASMAWRGYHVAIDATCLNGVTTGTQVFTLELIRALASAPSRTARLTVIVGDKTPREVWFDMDTLVDEVVSVSDLKQRALPAFDLVHRPFQVVSENDLQLLRSVAKRFVVSHLDCISYTNPSYMRDAEEWLNYRRLTELVFALADGIAFISEDAASDAAQQGLSVPSHRRCVTYLGVNHHWHTPPAGRAPARSETWADAPFLLMLGTNFKHKNRVYALKLFAALVQQFCWPGRLVLAGPSVASGGSVAAEAQWHADNPTLRERVIDLGAVGEAEKHWLLSHAALVLYPSIYEGFGMVPFEAAARGTATITTRMTSLSEVLGDQLLYLDTLDSARGAQTVWRLLSDPLLRQRQLAAVKQREESFTWEQVADRTWRFYAQVLQLPPRVPAVLADVLTDAESRAGARRESALRAWLRRAPLALHILRTQGVSALRKEVRQYLRWRAAQF